MMDSFKDFMNNWKKVATNNDPRDYFYNQCASFFEHNWELFGEKELVWIASNRVLFTDSAQVKEALYFKITDLIQNKMRDKEAVADSLWHAFGQLNTEKHGIMTHVQHGAKKLLQKYLKENSSVAEQEFPSLAKSPLFYASVKEMLEESPSSVSKVLLKQYLAHHLHEYKALDPIAPEVVVQIIREDSQVASMMLERSFNVPMKPVVKEALAQAAAREYVNNPESQNGVNFKKYLDAFGNDFYVCLIQETSSSDLWTQRVKESLSCKDRGHVRKNEISMNLLQYVALHAEAKDHVQRLMPIVEQHKDIFMAPVMEEFNGIAMPTSLTKIAFEHHADSTIFIFLSLAKEMLPEQEKAMFANVVMKEAFKHGERLEWVARTMESISSQDLPYYLQARDFWENHHPAHNEPASRFVEKSLLEAKLKDVSLGASAKKVKI